MGTPFSMRSAQVRRSQSPGDDMNISTLDQRRPLLELS
jgi:hypothetical protein